MQQIGAKDNLSESDIFRLSKLYKLEYIQKYSLIDKGNINSNYILTTESGMFVLRLYKFKTIEEAKSEIELLNYLSQKNFPCLNPLGGIESANGKPAACFKYIEGDALADLGDQELREAGKLLAELHILTENYKPKYHREGEGVSVISHYLEIKKGEILNSKFEDSFKFISFLKNELRKISFGQELPSGVVHADVKPENIIRGSKGQLYLIDFDNWYIDAFVVDIGSTIMWLCVNDKKISIQKMNIFLKAYEGVRKLNKTEKNKMKDAILYNCLKQAFKYAYICLPRLEFAQERAYYFISLYVNICKQELDYEF